jgi:hypothetical protein
MPKERAHSANKFFRWAQSQKGGWGRLLTSEGRCPPLPSSPSNRNPDFCFYFWMHMHPYTYLCLPICLPVCLSQLALCKDDINAHPLRPMSYWLDQMDNGLG